MFAIVNGLFFRRKLREIFKVDCQQQKCCNKQQRCNYGNNVVYFASKTDKTENKDVKFSFGNYVKAEDEIDEFVIFRKFSQKLCFISP